MLAEAFMSRDHLDSKRLGHLMGCLLIKVSSLNNMTNTLKVWNKDVFGNIFHCKKEFISQNWRYSYGFEWREKPIHGQIGEGTGVGI